VRDIELRSSYVLKYFYPVTIGDHAFYAPATIVINVNFQSAYVKQGTLTKYLTSVCRECEDNFLIARLQHSQEMLAAEFEQLRRCRTNVAEREEYQWPHEECQLY
jgi:hypothetical protein